MNMNELIRLAEFLDGIGYEIVESSDEQYEKDYIRDRPHHTRGIALRIIRVREPKAPPAPSEPS